MLILSTPTLMSEQNLSVAVSYLVTFDRCLDSSWSSFTFEDPFSFEGNIVQGLLGLRSFTRSGLAEYGHIPMYQ